MLFFFIEPNCELQQPNYGALVVLIEQKYNANIFNAEQSQNC